MKLYRIVALIVALVVSAFPMSACTSQKAQKDDNTGTAVTPMEYTMDGSSTRYTGKSINLPIAGVTLQLAVKSQRGAFLYGLSEDGDAHFFIYDCAKSKITEISSFGSDKAEAIAASPDGRLHVLKIDEDGNYFVISAAPDGGVTRLNPDFDDYVGDIVYTFYASNNGFFFQLSHGVIAVSAEGKIVQDYGEHSGGETVLVFDNKTCLVQIGMQQNVPGSLQNDRTVIAELNEDFSIGQSYNVGQLFTAFYPGEDRQVLALMNNTLYIYDPAAGKSTALVNLLTSSMDTTELVCLGDGTFLTLQRGVPYVWQPAPNGETAIITLATYNLSYDMEYVIRAFNQSGGACTISTIDYADYDTYDSANSGMTKLNTDIISGKVPDIYDLSCFSTESFAEKGLLEDLKPYFKASNAVSYDLLLSCVSRNAEFKERLYTLIPSFKIVTLCGNATTITGKNWSISDFTLFASQYPAEKLFGGDYTRRDFLSNVLCFMKEDLYSEESLFCNFESDGFISMLEFASNLPANVVMDGNQGEPFGRSYAGEQILMRTNLGCFAVDEISLMDAIYGGRAGILGFPTDTASGVGIRPCSKLAMSSASTNKAGVWEFFEFLLSDAVQLNRGMFDGLPAVRTAFEKSVDLQIDAATKTQPNAYGLSKEGPVHFEGAPVDETTMRITLNELTNRADCVTDCDESILNIVMNCAEPYFAGAKTVEAAANEIQSKASIYLAEQYG